MPQSRNRPGHEHHKPADVPSSQRVKGRVIWAILFAIFGGMLVFFGVGNNYLLLILTVAVSAIIGFAIGKRMERDASHK